MRTNILLATLLAARILSGCATPGEQERQVYDLGHKAALQIHAAGTEPRSAEAAIVVEATRLAAKAAGAPGQPIAPSQFAATAKAAEQTIEAGFWSTPLGDALQLALLAVGLGGLGQGLRLLRHKTQLFSTVVSAIDLFADDHPRAAKDLKRVIGEESTDVKGFSRAVARAKGRTGV